MAAHAAVQRLRLAGCRWAMAAGLVVLTVAAWSIARSGRRAEIEIVPERINPNTAPAASLMRLPGIGKVRALDIVEFRNAQEPPAFESAASLEPIKGIGPKTIEAMSEYLTFD